MVVELIPRADISGRPTSAPRPSPPGAEDRTEA